MAVATQRKPSKNKSKLRPLADRVVLRLADAEEKTKGGIVLPDKAKKKADRGRVEAVGSGKLLDSGQRAAMQVKPGDEVLFSQYTGDEVELGTDDRLIIRESDILAVIEKTQVTPNRKG